MTADSSTEHSAFAERFTLDGEIGRGATCVVYRAHDSVEDRWVAIKMLTAEHFDPLAVERFAEEVRRHQTLQHPHILPILDFGDAGGQWYAVLPLMRDGTLRARLHSEKQLALTEAIAISRAMALALGHAHRHGIVHRDVKPENILFANGEPFLADFGIAKVYEAPPSGLDTTVGMVRGTAPYMSPEQAAGERGYDGRSDIFSLGCVLYEMLTGMQPFVGPTQYAVMTQRLMHDPRPMHVYRPVPAPLESIVARALQVTPADRFPSGEAMAQALDDAAKAIADQPPVARTPAKPTRRPLLVASFFGVAVISIAAVVASRVVRETRTAPTRTIPMGDPRRIAVLYLDNQTPDVLPAYVVDGISEDMIDQLGTARALHVISPNGVRPLRGRPISPDSVGRELSVGTVVSGNVAREGNTLRVNVRLSDAKSNQLLYSIPIETQWTEAFALRDLLADKLAFYLRQRLGNEIALRERRVATKSFTAWERAQLGTEMLRQANDASILRGDPGADVMYERADSAYARAEQLDPLWSYPSVQRGRIAIQQSLQAPTSADTEPGGTTPSSRVHRLRWTRRALAIAELALKHSPDDADALSLRGEVKYGLIGLGVTDADTVALSAARDLRQALDARPDLASAWLALAKLDILDGHFADGAAAARRAFESDAYFEVPNTVSTALFAALRANEFDDARRWCRFGLSHYGGDPRFSECDLTVLGWTGKTAADVDAAWRALARIEQQDANHILAATWGYRRMMISALLARAQLPDSARAVLVSVKAQASKDPSLARRTLPEAYVRLLLHDVSGAIETIAARLEVSPQSRVEVASLPWFAPLHGDPRFEALVKPPTRIGISTSR